MPPIALLEGRNILCSWKTDCAAYSCDSNYSTAHNAKAAGTIADASTLAAASRLAPATWTGVDEEVPLAVLVAPEPLVPLDPPVAPGLLVDPAVAVAFEPPAEGEGEGIAFVGSTAGSYLSQTAPSAKGHYRSQSQPESYISSKER